MMKKRRQVRSIDLPSRARRRRPTRQLIVPRQVTSGIVMGIDPGIRFLGWSVSKVDPGHSGASLLDYGTIYGKGKGTRVIANIAEQVREIQDTHSVDVLAIEDFVPMRGLRLRGVFVVPALIGVLKYDWFVRHANEPVMIPASTWKTALFGRPNASKDEIRALMRKYLPDQLVDDIEQEYNNAKKKGSQDCLDSIAVGLFGSLMILQNRELNGIDRISK